MVRLYLLLFLRSIGKSRIYFWLHILGLSFALASVLGISLAVYQQFSFDTFHDNYKLIYRVTTHSSRNGKEQKLALAEGGIPSYLQNSMSGIASSTRILNYNTHPLFKSNDTSFTEDHGYYVDEHFNNVFSFHYLSGTPENMFSVPNTIAVSTDIALKYFNSINVLGKSLTVNLGEGDKDAEFKIIGVFERIPDNSHLQFQYLISGNTLSWWNDSLSDTSFFVYFKLTDQPTSESLAEINKYLNVRLEKAFVSRGEKPGPGEYHNNEIQPISEIHFDGSHLFEIAPISSITYLYVLITVAALIVIVSVINHFNLSAASLFRRTKEIGIRKIVGSTSHQFLFSIFLEAFALSVMVFSITCLIVHGALQFSAVRQLLMAESLFRVPSLLVYAYLTTVVLFFVSNLLLFLKIKSIDINNLKTRGVSSQNGALHLQNVLIGSQLMITIMLLSFTSIVLSQLSFLTNKDLGFNKENLIIVTPPSIISQGTWNRFLSDLQNETLIESVGQSTFNPFDNYFSTTIALSDNNPAHIEPVKAFYSFADENYLRTMGTPILSGENFSRKWSFSNPGILVNEEAFKRLNDPYIVGKTISTKALNGFNDSKTGTIIGVIKDFHSQAFDKPIEPLVLIYTPGTESMYKAVIKLKSPISESGIEKIADIWKRSGIESSFEYTIFEDEFNENIQSVSKLRIIITAFSILSILITIAGFVGLMSNLTHQKAKSISVRKVLGASVWNIAFSLNRNNIFVFIISASFSTIGILIFAHTWLNKFAYQTELSFVPLIGILLITFFIMLITVSFQSYVAASQNPLKNLKSE